MRCSIPVAIVLACSPLFSQSETPQRLVQLSVVASTSKGDPVTDLQASEVRLREDGKPRPLLFFRFDGSRRETASPAAGEFVNRRGITPTVILFDRWNERLMTAASAWNDIGTALQGLESVERIYIYFLTNRGDLHPVHPLPPPDSDLRGAAPLPPAQLRAWLDDAVRKLAGFRDIDAYDPILRANTTFQALTKLGAEMSAIAGRKNFIWVTHGFPLQTIIEGESFDFTPQVRKLATAVAQSNIAMYTVDESEEGAGADLIGQARATLQMLSSLTGGRWYESGDSGSALNGALADGRAAYRVAYESAFRPGDKKEHKIRLDASRKNIHLLTREGYFGDDPEPDPNILEEASFRAECHSPFDASDIAVRVALLHQPQGEHFTMRVSPSDVLLRQHGDKYEGAVAVAFALYSNGEFKEVSEPVTTQVSLTSDQLKDGIVINQDVPAIAGIDRIRVMVYDDGLHALGTVTVPTK